MPISSPLGPEENSIFMPVEKRGWILPPATPLRAGAWG